MNIIFLDIDGVLTDIERVCDQVVLINKGNIILNDEEIRIVVEVMGGVEPAYTFVKAMLEAGKHVATSHHHFEKHRR